MSEKEYIVTLQKNVNYQKFDQEMIDITGAGAIPKRAVSIVHARPASQRNTHYMLTDAEASFLRADARVMAVEIPPEQQSDLVIGHVASQTGDFTKTASDSGVFINWGLKRINEDTNTYNGNFTEGTYDYTLDGSGIDIVIQDSGLQIDHPEFQDTLGNSRVEELDWYTASGLVGSMPPGHYTDYDGHGTHCAGIAAGKTYGWAKNAKIYAVKVAGLQGPTDPNGGIPISGGFCFDVIKEWHKNKPIDPTTGVKRPTVVNMSWGYGISYTSVSTIRYKGLTYSGSAIDTANERGNYGLLNIYDAINNRWTTNVRVPSVDTDIQEMIDAGIHVFIAAGNRSHKIDKVTGADYNNYATTSSGTVYYHRGSSPYDDQAVIVGSIDSAIHATDVEQKALYSETGPGVDIYAPGTNIMSCTSTINKWGVGSQAYLATDPIFKQTNISGTSMAAPQVAGVTALYLQANPGATPAEAKAWILSKSKSNLLYTTNLDNDYTQYRSLIGGENKFVFNTFNSGIQLKLGSQSDEVVLTPTYILTSSAASVNEGDSFVITLATTNVINGTNIPYTISGVSNSDISDASLTGNFTIQSNTATLTVNISSDITTEGTESFVISLDDLNVTTSVTINDTSLTPVGAPTYIVSSANSVNEGEPIQFNVSTTNVDDGTTLYWSLSNSGDFGDDSTGNFTITSNSGSFTVTPTADTTTEGAETFIASIRTGSIIGTVVGTSNTITINDTSLTPDFIARTVTVASGENSYGTGNKYYIAEVAGVSPVLNLIEGQTYRFDQSDSSNNTHQLLFSETPNGTWDGGTEYTIGVTKVGTAGTAGAYTQISVAAGAPTLYYYCINHSGMGSTANTVAGAAVYSLSTSASSLQEGEKTTFTLNTTNVGDTTLVPYTITGISSSDMDTGPRSSSAVADTVGYGSNFFTREIRTSGVRLVSAGSVGGQIAVPDAFIEKVARMFQLFTNPSGVGINMNKQNQLIETLLGNTTSYHSPKPTIQRIARGAGGDYTPNFLTDAGIRSWGLEPLFDETVNNDMVWYLNSSGTPGTGDEDAQEVIEHVFHTLHMHGLDAATLKMYPQISADWATSDLYAAMAQAFDAGKWDPSGYAPNWKSDSGQYEVAVKEYLYLLNFCMFEYTELWDGGSLAPEWTDDMRTQSGILANNPLGYALFNTHIGDVISKPTLATIRSIFQDGDIGDPTQAGSSGYVADTPISLTGNFTIISNTSELEINIAKDRTTDGNETLTLALDNGEDSDNVSITDSSQNIGSSYYAYPAIDNVGEGSALTINVVTTDVADSTPLYWTVTNSGDFSTSSGVFTITNDTGSFTVTPTADSTTEGAETFQVQIRTGSTSGTIVNTTTPITINDVSTTPVVFTPDYTINISNSGFDYILSGTDRSGSVSGVYPALSFNSGDKVQFNVNAGTSSSHPVYIKTVAGAGSADQASGTTGQGTTTIEWTIGSSGTYYYQCLIHGPMTGNITVS